MRARFDFRLLGHYYHFKGGNKNDVALKEELLRDLRWVVLCQHGVAAILDVPDNETPRDIRIQLKSISTSPRQNKGWKVCTANQYSLYFDGGWGSVTITDNMADIIESLFPSQTFCCKITAL